MTRFIIITLALLLYAHEGMTAQTQQLTQNTDRIARPSLDRNVIPVHADVHEDITRAAAGMLASGQRTIPVMILPAAGERERSIAEDANRIGR